jgi:hypothetical protein
MGSRTMRGGVLMRRILGVVSVVVLAGCPEPIGDRCGPDLPPCPSGQSCLDGRCQAAMGGGAAGGATSGGTSGGASGGMAGGTAGGSSGGVAGGEAGGMAGGDAGGSAGGVAGGDAGGSAGGDAGGMAGGDAGGMAGGTAGGAAGGMAGGSAGGLAGGVAGGMSGGTAGGAAGGAPPMRTCPSSCPVFAPCEADFDGGRCVPLTVTIVAPPDQSTYDAGTSVGVQVNALLRDGGLFAISIPVNSTFGTNTTRTSGTGAPLTLPSTAGVHRIAAGWDGGPGASVQVSTLSCIASCQPWQQCRATTDGGACDSLNLTLTWNSPDAGLAFNTATVPARLTVSRSGPIPASLTSVPVFGQAGAAQSGSSPLSPLTGSNGTYTGALPLFSPDAVNKTFVAGWPDGGPTATLVIERDTTPPLVTLSPTQRPATFPDPDPAGTTRWKRHETALIRVTVTGGRTALASDLFSPDSGVTFSASAADCGCAGNLACQCFDFPLSRAPIVDIGSGRPAARVAVRSIADAVGNPSAVIEDAVDVTRFFWSRPVSNSGNLGLAVSPDGLIVTTVSGGSVVAHEPDGGLHWLVRVAPNATFSSSPTVGTSDVYLSVREPGSSRIQKLSLATGADTGALCEQPSSVPFREIALGQSLTGTDVPIAIRDPFITAAIGACPEGKADPGATDVSSRLVSGQLELFSAGTGLVHKAVFDGFSVLDAGVLTTGAGPLFLADNRVGWATPSNIETASSSGPLGPPTTSTAGEGSVVPPVVSGSTLFGTASTGQFLACPFARSTGVFGTCALASPQGSINQSYIIGAQGLLLEIAGTQVRIRTAAGVVVSSPLTLPEAPVLGAVALVPLRNPNGSKRCGEGVGLLYVRLSSELVAYIVDIEGLDGTAPWPMYRHDPANSGFLDRSLAPWSCP